jgi:hypothetical protein
MEVVKSGAAVIVEADGMVAALIPLDNADDLERLEDILDILVGEKQLDEHRRDPAASVPFEALRRELDETQNVDKNR